MLKIALRQTANGLKAYIGNFRTGGWVQRAFLQQVVPAMKACANLRGTPVKDRKAKVRECGNKLRGTIHLTRPT